MNKYLLISIPIFCVVFFFIGRRSTPTKIQVEEKYVDRIVVKTDETKVQQLIQQVASLQTELLTVRQSSIKTMHVVKKPDGTTETTSQIVTNSETNKHNTNSTSTNTTNSSIDSVSMSSDTLHQKETSKTQTTISSQWHVSVLVGTRFNNLNIKTTAPYLDPLYYGVVVNRQILGPFYVGVWALTNKSGGLSLGVKF